MDRTELGTFVAGGIPWNKGKKMSWESRQKMSLAKVGKPSPLVGRIRPDMIGDRNPNFQKFGINHPRWSGSKKHSIHKSIRETYKYRAWRLSVFERDKFTCVLCNQRGGKLQVDHYPCSFIGIIEKNMVDSVEKSLDCIQLFDITNGRTLCETCHRKTDTWGRRRIN